MALLDTLKKGLGTAVSYATAPITAPFKAAASSVKSTVDLARKAASMAPTNDPNKLFSSTGGQKSLQNDTVFTVPQGGGMQTVTKGPAPTVSQSNPINRPGDIGVPQVGANAVAPKAVTVPNPLAPATAPAPKATAPAVNTQVSGSNPFGNSNYTPTFSNPNPAPVAPTTPAPTAPPATGYINTPPPTANGTTQNTQLAELQKALLGTYNQTPEEKQAQDALVALAKQQADLSGAFRSGTNKIGEQPIVLDLLRGQQQALQNQYEGQVGALADQAKPLEVQLANLLANREQQNKALTTEYGFASEEQKRQDAIQQAQASGNKPIEVGGSLLQLNPQTGQYEVIYRAPSEDANGFTLSEGQIRYDANGNPIAMGGQKSGSESPGKIVSVNGTDYFQDAYGNLSIPNTPSNPADQQKTQVLQDKLGLIDSLLNSKGMAGSVGAYGVSRWTPFTADKSERMEFAAGINQLINKETIDTLINLKQQGGTLGALSDQERILLQSATSKIGSWMKRDSDGNPTGKFEVSEEAFKKELNQLKSLTQKAIANASGSSQITTQSLVQRGVRQDLVDQLTAMGKTPQEIAQIAGISFPNAPSKALNGSKIGSLSAKYESGGNPGAIGYDSTGGYSYGTYQLAHNNAQKFVSQSPYAQQFAGIPFNSAQFQQKWKQIAQNDPQGFASAQHDYIAKTHLEPIVTRLKAKGMDVSRMSPVVQDVMWSTAVQHGPGNKIIEQALATAKDEQDFIKKVYQLRWNGGAGFASSTPAVKQSVYNRFFGANGELAQALARSTA